jgi:hypothetical protein
MGERRRPMLRAAGEVTGSPDRRGTRALAVRVPPGARQCARRLCALFARDRQLAREQDAAHERFAAAAERLVGALSPEALRSILAPGGEHPAVVARAQRRLPHAQPGSALDRVADALRGAFGDYHDIADRRRRLAGEADEETVVLVSELVAAGWSERDARNANVWQLAELQRDRSVL